MRRADGDQVPRDLAGMPLLERARLAVSSLRHDLRSTPWRVVVNRFAASELVPRVVRHLIYRRCGIDAKSANIYPGCRFTGRRVTIGQGTFVNNGVLFEATGWITVGSYCQIAPEVAILTADHSRTASGDFSWRPTALTTRIGDHCWLGSRSIVMPGVLVAEGTIVGAGAVVTRDTLPYGVYAGAPATRIADRSVSERGTAT